MENKLIPPENIYVTVTLTYTELRRILWLFGTSVAVRAQEVKDNNTTCHTDAFVLPLVSREIDNIHKQLNKLYDNKD